MAKGPTVNKLSVTVRTKTGKGASRQARREGLVPVVLFLAAGQRAAGRRGVVVWRDTAAAPIFCPNSFERSRWPTRWRAGRTAPG